MEALLPGVQVCSNWEPGVRQSASGAAAGGYTVKNRPPPHLPTHRAARPGQASGAPVTSHSIGGLGCRGGRQRRWRRGNCRCGVGCGGRDSAEDAALQRTLHEAAERIRDFQWRAEHEAQQLQLEGALQPLRAQHAEEAGRLRQQLAAAEAEREALRLRAADVEEAQSPAAGERDAWKQRAEAAQDQLEASLQQHEASAGALQQQLATAEAREQQLAAALPQAQAASAAQAAGLQQELAAQQVAAATATAELAAAGAAWQEERHLRGIASSSRQRRQAS